MIWSQRFVKINQNNFARKGPKCPGTENDFNYHLKTGSLKGMKPAFKCYKGSNFSYYIRISLIILAIFELFQYEVIPVQFGIAKIQASVSDTAKYL